MILILSNSIDQITNDVIDWLDYKNQGYMKITSKSIYNSNISISFENDIFFNQFQNVKVVWFRRWGGEAKEDFETIENQHDRETLAIRTIDKLFHENLSVISEYFFFILRNKKWLTNPRQVRVNKLIVLEKAIKAKLIIPISLLTNEKHILGKFIDNKISVITKPVADSMYIPFETDLYASYTSNICKEHINQLTSIDFFQEEIIKEFEIRSFYIYEKFYSMAIFSQRDNKTKLDFRRYNKTKPNRNVPIQLPKSIEIKLTKLIKSLKLDTCSVDLIKTTNNNYIFLEINPVGQFGMVSHPCNYNLEKIVAEQLTKMNGQ